MPTDERNKKPNLARVHCQCGWEGPAFVFADHQRVYGVHGHRERVAPVVESERANCDEYCIGPDCHMKPRCEPRSVQRRIEIQSECDPRDSCTCPDCPSNSVERDTPRVAPSEAWQISEARRIGRAEGEKAATERGVATERERVRRIIEGLRAAAEYEQGMVRYKCSEWMIYRDQMDTLDDLLAALDEGATDD